jgi:hypothetical protein
MTNQEAPPVQDEDESFDATDEGNDKTSDEEAAYLYAQMLEDLAVAGFPRDPDDPDGSKLGGK